MSFDAPIHTSEANLGRVLAVGLPTLLVFWRRDCVPCDQLMPVLERLARAYAGRALIVKVNAAEEAGLVQRYQITNLPSIVFIKEGQSLATSIGAAVEQELAAWLDYLVTGTARPPVPAGPSMPFQRAQVGAREQRPSGSAQGRPEEAVRPAHQDTAAGQPIILTDANFDQVIHDSKVPVLVDFWATWCAPCKMVAPIVTNLAREYAGRAVVGKLDVDENPRTASRYGVMSIPMLLIFKGGRVVDQLVGAQPAQVLRERLARQVG
jgi:thioredoxin